MRQLGGRIASTAPETISRTLVSPVAVTTTYDPALVETTTGLSVGDPFNGSGAEAALSEFDAQLDASVFWEKNRRPQNRVPTRSATRFRPQIFAQDTGTFTIGHHQDDGRRHDVRIPQQHDLRAKQRSVDDPATVAVEGLKAFASEWHTNFEASFNHPLLQGSGAQYNRIAGPLSFDQYAAGLGNPIDGVMIARIRTDQTLADFEGGVRNLMRDVEDAYWELYFAYRDLEARKMGRDSALETWKKTARAVPHRLARRQRRPRGPGPLAILPVPLAGGASAHRSVPRRESVAVHHGPVDVGRPLDSSVGRADDGPRGVRLVAAFIAKRSRVAWKFAGRSGKSSGASWN